MEPYKQSPWETSRPGGRPGRAPRIGKDGSAHYWISQPHWYQGPAILLTILLFSGAYLLIDERVHWGVLVAMALTGLALFASTFTGRLVLEARGFVVRRIGTIRFVPYSQVSSIRIGTTGIGQYREQYLEIGLVYGDPIKVSGADDSIRRAILAATAAWERSRDEAEPQGPSSTPRDRAGPYRGRSGD